MRWSAPSLAVISAAAIVGAGPAAAGTTSLEGDTVVFRAARSEVNHVTVSTSADGSVLVTDAGAPLAAGADCANVSSNEVTCEESGLVRVHLRDGDDTLSLRALDPELVFATAAYGGPGADHLVGGAAIDHLYGQGGEDVIEGRRGWDFDRFGVVGDFLDGGPGDDTLRGQWGPDVLVGGAGADRMSGGPGRDAVSYLRKTAPVRVTLDGRANDGQRNERDRVRPDVEFVVGGRAGDTLIGNSMANRLSGWRGDDVIRGLGGPDRLSGDSGSDDVGGGPGPDRISGSYDPDPYGPYDEPAPGADRLRGGPGRDRILSLDHRGDELVDGGPGRDRAWVDAIVDHVRSVEMVSFSFRGVSAASGDGGGRTAPRFSRRAHGFRFADPAG